MKAYSEDYQETVDIVRDELDNNPDQKYKFEY